MSKTALVTGGNRGLGLEIVKELAARGYKTLLGCRDIDQGAEAAGELHGDIKVVHVDLSDSNALRKQVRDILERHDIDILINNGAIIKDGTVLDAERQDFYDSVQVNLVACFDLIQEISPTMIRRGYGRIVNVTSDWGSFADGLTGPVAYSVTKAALNALTMNMARDLPSNIKVNSVHPGWLKTDMGGS
ncbi:MAG: SDR family NAD(P)-dependent oxidoreductase, partial [Kordiimonadaceae bacterium]|nr:SDR family NAD(P)-dependent oxidoreductase [Kordiimonadaceae bacterium]